uniref:Uncharacterized protein n=1 Tax=Tetradesmus obliquus TaxID=3088 RepID=A0A383W0A9_TETOB
MASIGRTAHLAVAMVVLFAALAPADANGSPGTSSNTQQRQLLWPDSKAQPAKPSAPKQTANMGDTAAAGFARLDGRRLQQHATEQSNPTYAVTAKHATAPFDSASDSFEGLGKRLLAADGPARQQRQLLWPDSKAQPAKPSAPKQTANMGDTAAAEFARLDGRRLQQQQQQQQRKLLWPDSKAQPAKPSAPKQTANMGDTAAAGFARLDGRRLQQQQQQRQLLWPDSKAQPAKPSAPKQTANMGDTAAAEFARLDGRRLQQQQRQLLWPDSKAQPAKPSAPKQTANMGDTAAAEFARLDGRRLLELIKM